MGLLGVDKLVRGNAVWFCIGDFGELRSSRAMERAVSGRGFDEPSTGATTPSTSLRLVALLCGAVAMPPAAGRPSSSRLAFHCLYFVSGNRSLTSSMDINFFSLLLRWGRGIAARSMGSPSAAARAARFRWLYRKQYLTPTMILNKPSVSAGEAIHDYRIRMSIPEIREDDTEPKSDEKQQRGAGRPASRIISRTRW